jgi:hypothetical protein
MGSGHRASFGQRKHPLLDGASHQLSSLGDSLVWHMTHIPAARSYFDKLAHHANVLIPALGGACDEEYGPYMALGDIRRFFFQPARTLEEQRQVLTFINHSLEIGGKYTEEAIVLELFTEVYYYNEPFTSLFRDHLSPAAWTLFLTQREIARQRGTWIVTDEGQSRPYEE